MDAKESDYLLPLITMGFRFRKSVSLFPGVRLNIGKKGLGVSAGVKGARVGVNSKGTYSSVGIPGTGISSVNYHGKGKKLQQSTPSTRDAAKGFLFFLGLIVVVIGLFMSAEITLMLVLLAIIVAGLVSYRRKAKNDSKTSPL